MRQSIAIAALVAFAGLSGQAMAQSRYGPPPSGRAAQAEPAFEAVRSHPQEPAPAMLSWRGKTVVAPPAAAQQAAEPEQPSRPEPVAPWSQRIASITPPAAPLPPAVAAAASPALPTHLYDTPPAPRAQPAPRPTAAPVQPAAVQRAPAAAPIPAPVPAQTALLGAPPAPRPATAPINPSATAGPRFYSVYREYGVAPDAIPTAPNAGRGQETTLREIPSTPSLAGQDDTQYLPSRPNAEAASRRTF